MKRFFKSLALGILLSLPWVGAQAQQVNMYWNTGGAGFNAWQPVSATNPLPITGSLSIAGATSNASSAVATSSTNLPTVSYNYGFNGTTWDQIQVDGSKNLKVNCTVGCAAGSISNASSAVATSSTSLGVVSYNYGFNGTTWDQLQVDASKNLKVNVVTGGGGGVADETAFTYGSSTYSPIGGVYNASITNLTSGQGGAAALTAARAVNIDAVTGSNLAALAAAPDPCKAASTWNASTGLTGTQPAGCDGSAALWADIGAINGVQVLTGTGATGTGAQRVTVSTDQATNAGAALVKGGVGVVNGGSFYVTVAASQTAQVLQSSTGAAGDYLSHCVIQPTTTAAGTVIILDNATTIFTFTTGTLSNLVPFSIPVGAISTSGAWKVTTGANETVTCVGKFS